MHLFDPERDQMLEEALDALASDAGYDNVAEMDEVTGGGSRDLDVEIVEK